MALKNGTRNKISCGYDLTFLKSFLKNLQPLCKMIRNFFLQSDITVGVPDGKNDQFANFL
jgi:hypothetical protein